MALPIGEQSAELLKAQDLIWNHLYRFISSMSLRYATELGIPDIIHRHGKPMTLQLLVDALPINKAKAHGVHRLMRILIHSGFFIEEKISEDEAVMGYWLTPGFPTPHQRRVLQYVSNCTSLLQSNCVKAMGSCEGMV
ncbi:Hydroxyindole-O-methyltransferase [Abeliophyllum distichum]|uniref:Hydroxyindole-O-methyltransferase n=1 Tax=Abeliophyllum distichum TaxID=126358 RepID=A0ABD1PRP1_9LAMI